MFYFYGSKGRLAGSYPPPLHDTIIEPFAGAAAYAMHHVHRESVKRVVLVEKDGRVAATWGRLLAMTIDDLRTYPIPLPGESTSDFLLMTASTSNAIARCERMTVTRRQVGAFRKMLKRIETVLPWAQAKVEIITGDYREAPDLVDATWFIDPPYSRSARAANGTSRPQGAGYARGCDTDSLDYQSLGEWCRTRPGQRIVCEYAGASWLPFQPLRSSLDSLGRIAGEVCWAEPEHPPIPPQDALLRLRRAARSRDRAEHSFREAIHAARSEGMSLRTIARQANVSHMHIARLVRGDRTTDDLGGR